MHDVWRDVVQQPLIVCHDQEGALRVAELIHSLSNRSQRVDVQTRIGLVQNREPWLEDGELQNLVTLLFATRETFVHRAVHHRIVPADSFEFRFQDLEEIDRIELLLTSVPANRIDRRAQEIGVRDAAYFDGILEREEDSVTRALFRIHVEQVFPVIRHCPGEYAVGRVTGQYLRERTLARAIRTHDRVDFTLAHGEIDALEDLIAGDRDA